MKLIKYKEPTKQEKLQSKKACYVFMIGCSISLICLAVAGSNFSWISLVFGCLAIFLFFGSLFLTGKIMPVSRNKAYYEQQAELDRLKELEKSCGEYHRLKNKYKGVKV